MTELSFTVGDLIWGKMRGYPPWPGEISPPPETSVSKKGQYYIYFFGCNMWGWLPPKNIQHHNQNLVNQYRNSKKKHKNYEKAILAIIDAHRDRNQNEDFETSWDISPNTLQNVDSTVSDVEQNITGDNTDWESFELENDSESNSIEKVRQGNHDTNMEIKGKELRVVINRLDDDLVSEYIKKMSTKVNPVLKIRSHNKKEVKSVISKTPKGVSLKQKKYVKLKLPKKRRKIDDLSSIVMSSSSTSSSEESDAGSSQKCREREESKSLLPTISSETHNQDSNHSDIDLQSEHDEDMSTKAGSFFKVKFFNEKAKKRKTLSKKQKKYLNKLKSPKKLKNIDNLSGVTSSNFSEDSDSDSSQKCRKGLSPTTSCKTYSQDSSHNNMDVQSEHDEDMLIKPSSVLKVKFYNEKAKKRKYISNEHQGVSLEQKKYLNKLNSPKKLKEIDNLSSVTSPNFTNLSEESDVDSSQKCRNCLSPTTSCETYSEVSNHTDMDMQSENDVDINSTNFSEDSDSDSSQKCRKCLSPTTFCETHNQDSNHSDMDVQSEHDEDINSTNFSEKSDADSPQKCRKCLSPTTFFETHIKNLNHSDMDILFKRDVDINPSILFSPSNHPDCPEEPFVNFDIEVPKLKSVIPTKKKIGFLGLGRIGQNIVKNLIQSGHCITVWNRTASRCDQFHNVIKAKTPAEVVQTCDIVFSCLSSSTASKTVFFMKEGILPGLQTAEYDSIKGLVELTSLDPDTTKSLSQNVHDRGGRFLEAPLLGTKEDAQLGHLTVLAAGDKSLFDDCDSCFQAIAKQSLFVSKTAGAASSYSIIKNMLKGSVYAAVAEALALIDKIGLEKKMFINDLLANETFLQIDSNLLAYNDIFDNRENDSVLTGHKSVSIPLRYIQKSISTGLQLANSVGQPMLVMSTVNELYKHSKLNKYANHDVSAICKGIKK